MMKLLPYLAITCVLLVSGCSAARPQAVDTGGDAWPRVSMEARVMLVDEALLEEFGIEFEVLTEGTRQPADGAFVVAIDDLDVNLLVSATLAQQNSRVLNAPRLTIAPGQEGRAWVGPHGYFINDLGSERYDEPGGVGFAFVAEPTDAADPDAPLRVVIVVRMLPEAVWRGEELAWGEHGGVRRIQVYPAPSFRVQAECRSGVAYLAALPAPADDAPDTRRMLLLFKPVLVASREEELRLYPGLSEPPSPVR